MIFKCAREYGGVYGVRVCDGELAEVCRASCYDDSVYQTTFTGSEKTNTQVIHRVQKRGEKKERNT